MQLKKVRRLTLIIIPKQWPIEKSLNRNERCRSHRSQQPRLLFDLALPPRLLFWFGIASVSSPLDSGSPFRWLHGCRPSLVLSWGGRIHIHEYVYTTPTCMSWDSMELCQVLRRHACHEIVWNYATRHKGTRERVFWTQRKVRFWEGSRRHTLPLADLLSQNALSSYQTCKLRQ